MTDVMRIIPPNLTVQQRADMNDVKRNGEILHAIFVDIQQRGDGEPRELALAKTKLEEAVMWATKGIT
jgi:hypothetical protein